MKKNTCFQYEFSGAERSDIYHIGQERFKSRIAAIMLAEIMCLYILLNEKMVSEI
jgi:hypothetical protein